MNIVYKNIKLRAMELKDQPYLQEMLNDPEIEKMVVGWSFPTSEKQQIDWYNRVVGDSRNLRFAVEYDGQFVGLSTLVNIDWKNRSADHGIKLLSSTPKCKGIGTAAVTATMIYAFEELQLNRLYTSILDYNVPSQKLYEKCGWTIEGHYRQCVFKNNEYHDARFISILRNEYLEWIKKNK